MIGDDRIARISRAALGAWVIAAFACDSPAARRPPERPPAAPAQAAPAAALDSKPELPATEPAPAPAAEPSGQPKPCEQTAAAAPAAPDTPFERERCVAKLRSATLPGVLVPLKSGAPLRVNITGSAIDLAPSDRADGHARVRAHGALRFEGLALIERYGLGRLVDVAPGLIRVGPGAIASQVRADGNAVVASLEVGPIELVDARFACSALATTDELASSLEPVLGPESFGARDVPLRLRRAPSESAPQIAALSGSMALSKLSEKGGWAQVRVEFRGGSAITGWTESAALEPLPSGYQSAAPVRGLGLCREGCAPNDYGLPEPQPGKLRAGTPVHAAPSGEIWAHVERAIEAVVRTRDDGWVQLVEAPGIDEDAGCKTLLHAFVPAAAVTLRNKR